MNKLIVTVTVAVLAAGAFAKDAESELYSRVTNRQFRVEKLEAKESRCEKASEEIKDVYEPIIGLLEEVH